MFIHLAVHHPKPGCADDMLASMHRVGEAAQGAPGLIEIGAWQDAKSDRIIGLAKWESREAFQASVGAIFAVVADDPFDDWCAAPPDVFHLTEA